MIEIRNHSEDFDDSIFPKVYRSKDYQRNICEFIEDVAGNSYYVSYCSLSFTPLQTIYDIIWKHKKIKAFSTPEGVLRFVDGIKNHHKTQLSISRYASRSRELRPAYKYKGLNVFNTACYNQSHGNFLFGIVIPDINHVKRLLLEIILYGEILDYEGVFYYSPYNVVMNKEMLKFIKDYDIKQLNRNYYINKYPMEEKLSYDEIRENVIDIMTKTWK